MASPTVTELAARIDALEAKLSPGPLVLTPPITIGSLSNVPAPGGQLAAQWAQDVTGYVVHRFANKAALNAWAAPTGAFAVQTDNGILWRRVATGWSQQTPWYGTGTLAGVAGGDAVGSVNINTLTIPADPGLRSAHITSFTRFEVTAADTGGASPASLQLKMGGVLYEQADLSPEPGFPSTPWYFRNIAMSANVDLGAGVSALVSVVHLTQIPFGSQISGVGNPAYNRLSVVVTPRGQ